jgi:hypothetical protein
MMHAKLKARVVETISAMDRLANLAEPYAKLNPNITMGEVLLAESAKVAETAKEAVLPRWKRGKISIITRGGVARTTWAKVLGPLAVNPGCGFGKKAFVLTHRPTGYAIFSDASEQLLMRTAERIVHLDWSFHKPDGQPRASQMAAWVVVSAARLGLLN